MEDIYNVKLTRKALKNLKKIPVHITIKLQAWIEDVGHHGLSEVRKVPGYHDEPLHGARDGQRSIRLNHSYRAIYMIEKNKKISFIEVIEVNNHDY